MILLLTRPEDVHAQAVIPFLQAANVPFVFFSYDDFPAESTITFYQSSDGPFEGVIRGAKWMVSGEVQQAPPVMLKDITSVWDRRPGVPKPHGHLDTDVARYVKYEATAMVNALSEVLDHARWLSAPSAVRRAELKALQMKVAAELGWSLPPTLMGNDVESARRFLEGIPVGAMKALSYGMAEVTPSWLERVAAQWVFWAQDRLGHGNPVLREDPTRHVEKAYALFTQRFETPELLAHLESLSVCPVILQPYVEKAYELRVTVVGERVFACALESQKQPKARGKIDFRLADIDATCHRPVALAPEIEARCVGLVRALGLGFGCLDLIVTPAGETVFLEVNPVGQWLWVEQKTGLPIAEAIAQWLMNPPALP